MRRSFNPGSTRLSSGFGGSVSVWAPAKINLFLHVGAKRTDGYHELQSLVVFADVGDELTFAESAELSLTVGGEFASTLPANDDNLVFRAARTLASLNGTAPLARIALTKNLPVASGIGGGSADAAATLRGLRSLWGLNRAGDDVLWGHPQPFANRQECLRAATVLGSDVPVCLLSAPALMEGRGERVRSLDGFPAAALVLINPGVAVSTAEVFGRLRQRTGADKMPHSDLACSINDLVEYLKRTTNDLEIPAVSIAPSIGDVLEALNSSGARLARMSGSGATCFGIFNESESAADAAAAIARAHPSWWVRATRIASRDIGRPTALAQ